VVFVFFVAVGQESIVFEGAAVLTKLMESTESLYTRYFAMGDRSKAMNELRVPDHEHIPGDMPWLLTGLFLGIAVTAIIGISADLCFLCGLECVFSRKTTTSHHRQHEFGEFVRGEWQCVHHVQRTWLAGFCAVGHFRQCVWMVNHGCQPHFDI
jgi:hypothetical protein